MDAPRVLFLLGPPNTGKTSLFNQLTHSHYRTVNYPGSTVECTVGELVGHPDWRVVDSPGIRSLRPKSDDERVTLAALRNLSTLDSQFESAPQQVVLVLDATAIARQLVLFRQLSAAGVSPVVALTMGDLVTRRGGKVDADLLSKRLGVPVYLVESRGGVGVDALKKGLLTAPNSGALPSQVQEQTDREAWMAAFQWAESVAAEVVKGKRHSRIDLDRWVMHPYLGLLGFAAVMTGLFWAIFAGVKPFVDGIDTLVGWSSGWVAQSVHPAIVGEFLSVGVIQSIGAVLIFVPQIALLFVLLGILENSGYLARGAALIDRPLASIGLTGKSFLPLMSGFACAIPAMMAARTISDRRSRVITLLIIPLMSCSARLPVFSLLVSLMVIRHGGLSGGVMMMGIYMSSVVVASVMGKVLSLFFPNPHPVGFQIELPEWRFPVMRQVVVHAFHQTRSFVTNAGPIIFVVGAVLWALMRFPDPANPVAYSIGKILNPVWHLMGVDWRIGVALIASLAAREVFVSAVVVVFAVSGSESITHVISSATNASGGVLFSTPTILSLIVFFMVAMQCVSTLAIARRELGNWSWVVAMGVGYTVLAYGLSVLVYQGAMRLLH